MKPVVNVIIPAYNEQLSIGKVLADIPRDIVDEIIVADNGSTDETARIASHAGATVVAEMRRGYGHACLRGIDYIKSKNERPDVIVFLDGDYSDHPEEMSILLNPIIEEGYDMVIGSRTIGNSEKGALLPQAVLGNALATILIKIFYGQEFTDLGPFRAVKFDRLLELDMKDKTYGWTVEMQVKAAKKKYKCAEVPVSYRKRIGKSKVTGTLGGSLKAGYKILWIIFKHLWPTAR
jgi:glycosyltransferase involved in cell wall biosynthesis